MADRAGLGQAATHASLVHRGEAAAVAADSSASIGGTSSDVRAASGDAPDANDTPGDTSADGSGTPGDAPAEDGSLLREVEPLDLAELADYRTFFDLLGQGFREVAGDVAVRLPWIVIGITSLLLALVVGRLVLAGINAGMRRANVDFAVRRLVVNLLRIAVLTLGVLLALSISGVDVRAALAAIGLVGLALAFALQNILENQISGILILTRKPFVRGDLIVTNGYEGYVEDIDLRVTTLREHDGKTTLVPNADVLTNSMTNFTRRGTRRTTVTVGVDYRDDHESAAEVLFWALTGVEGVLDDPAHEVLLVNLGDSSVDFEVRFWTSADNKTVRQTRHRVISACKHALEEAGMTIPWPIRTLAADRRPLDIQTTASPSPNGHAAGNDRDLARDRHVPNRDHDDHNRDHDDHNRDLTHDVEVAGERTDPTD